MLSLLVLPKCFLLAADVALQANGTLELDASWLVHPQLFLRKKHALALGTEELFERRMLGHIVDLLAVLVLQIAVHACIRLFILHAAVNQVCPENQNIAWR